MKLYIANGIYVGTQAEAKKIGKDRHEVDVPTDKYGLIDYLNKITLDPTDTTTTEPRAFEGLEPVVAVEAGRSGYTEQSVATDQAFEELPLSRQLHLAALALENAREVLP